MCEYCGKIINNQKILDKKAELKKMNEYLSKRGPDEDGYYINEHVALGHKRLIVLDPNGR